MSRGSPALLIVFVDALGPEQASLLSEAGLGLDHASALRGVLGYSSGAIPTILTGASPSKHGRMCLFSRAQNDSPLTALRWLGLLPRVIHERARVRRWVSKAFAASRGYDGYFALHKIPPAAFGSLDVPERNDLFEAASIGGVPTFLARARERGLRVAVSDWRAAECDRVRGIEATPDADLAFLYLSGLDAILHRDGRIENAAREWAKEAVRWIARARKALSHGARRRDVSILVVGDHGMAEVKRVVDPRPVLSAVSARLVHRFVFVDSTMLRVHAGEARDDVRELLSSLPGDVLDASDLAVCDAPSDGAYGDLVALLPEGTIFAPSWVGGRVRGMHGYARSSDSAHAALISDAPIARSVTRLEDVASLVYARLDLQREEAA
jgi:hypothetical protein